MTIGSITQTEDGMSVDTAFGSQTPTQMELPGIPANPTNAIADSLGIVTPLGRIALESLLECAILLDRKNRDYGPDNISAFGEKGVIVRVNDKIERLKTLVWGDKHPQHEKVEDTWKDLTNYGVIGLMCHRGDWR